MSSPSPLFIHNNIFSKKEQEPLCVFIASFLVRGIAFFESMVYKQPSKQSECIMNNDVKIQIIRKAIKKVVESGESENTDKVFFPYNGVKLDVEDFMFVELYFLHNAVDDLYKHLIQEGSESHIIALWELTEDMEKGYFNIEIEEEFRREVIAECLAELD